MVDRPKNDIETWFVPRLAIGGKHLIALALCASVSTSFAQSQLKDDFIAAAQFDPEFQGAIAQRDAGLEPVEQARANLRPQASINLQRSINNTDSRSTTSLGPVDRSFENYPSHNVSLQIRQALYRPRLWAALDQGKFQALYSELTLLAAEQELGLRLISTHAQWAVSQQVANLATEMVRVHERISRDLGRQREAGETTRVDVEIASARIRQAEAQLADAASNAATAQLAHSQMTGVSKQGGNAMASSKAKPLNLPPSLSERLPVSFKSLEAWRQGALHGNPVIKAQEAAMQAAQQELKKVSSDRLPTADLYASKSNAASAMENTVGTSFRSEAIGIQVNVPIYNGGAVNSQIRQATAMLRRAEQDLRAAQDKVALEVEREWHNLESSKALALAQRSLLKALDISLEAAQRGKVAGIASRIDVDQLLLQKITAQKDLALANARALNAWARLMASAGSLSQSSMQELQKAALDH